MLTIKIWQWRRGMWLVLAYIDGACVWTREFGSRSEARKVAADLKARAARYD